MSVETGQRRYCIPCRVAPGMFRDEWLVFVDTADPTNRHKSIHAQLLVDQREGTPSRSQPARGWLRVEWVGSQQGMAVIVLPQAAQPVGTTILVSEVVVQEDWS